MAVWTDAGSPHRVVLEQRPLFLSGRVPAYYQRPLWRRRSHTATDAGAPSPAHVALAGCLSHCCGLVAPCWSHSTSRRPAAAALRPPPSSRRHRRPACHHPLQPSAAGPQPSCGRRGSSSANHGPTTPRSMPAMAMTRRHIEEGSGVERFDRAPEKIVLGEFPWELPPLRRREAKIRTGDDDAGPTLAGSNSRMNRTVALMLGLVVALSWCDARLRGCPPARPPACSPAWTWGWTAGASSQGPAPPPRWGARMSLGLVAGLALSSAPVTNTELTPPRPVPHRAVLWRSQRTPAQSAPSRSKGFSRSRRPSFSCQAEAHRASQVARPAA